MEYVYAALVLERSDREINEVNLTAVLEAADVSVERSRVRALVAALEDVDLEAIEGSPTVPRRTGDGGVPDPSSMRGGEFDGGAGGKTERRANENGTVPAETGRRG